MPASTDGPATRKSAVGLCGIFGHDKRWHCSFAQLYFRKRESIFEVMMEEGRWADLSRNPSDLHRRAIQTGD